MTEADTTRTARGNLLAVVTAACLIAVTWLVYSPGLRGPFVGDDVINILDNPAVAISDLSVNSLLTALGSNSSGPSGRPLPGLGTGTGADFRQGVCTRSFRDDQPRPAYARTGCWCTSSRSAACAWQRAVRAAPSRACAVVVSAAWLLHPLQLTTVLYAVQRINGMAATGVLLGLVLLIHARLAMRAQPHAAVLASGCWWHSALVDYWACSAKKTPSPSWRLPTIEMLIGSSTTAWPAGLVR